VELMETSSSRKEPISCFFQFIASIIGSGINGNKNKLDWTIEVALKIASIIGSGINGNSKDYSFFLHFITSNRFYYWKWN